MNVRIEIRDAGQPRGYAEATIETAVTHEQIVYVRGPGVVVQAALYAYLEAAGPPVVRRP